MASGKEFQTDNERIRLTTMEDIERTTFRAADGGHGAGGGGGGGTGGGGFGERETAGIIAPPEERELEMARQDFVNERFEGKPDDHQTLELARDGLERLLSDYDSHLAERGLIKGLDPGIEY